MPDNDSNTSWQLGDGLSLDDAWLEVASPELLAELVVAIEFHRQVSSPDHWHQDPRAANAFEAVLKIKSRVWIEHLHPRLIAGTVRISHQPLELTAARQLLPADRCANVRPPMYFGGGQWSVDGNILHHVRLHLEPTATQQAAVVVPDAPQEGSEERPERTWRGHGIPMSDFGGWLPAPDIVQWLANLGAQGKLPRRLEFVHPGDTPTEFDRPAEAVARQLILDLLMASRVMAALFVEPQHRVVWLERADYWFSASAQATLTTGKLDLGVYRLDPDVMVVDVYLSAYEVAAALEFSLMPEGMEVSLPIASQAAEGPAKTSFDRHHAKAILAALKVSRFWPVDGPTDKQAGELLQRFFTHVPRAPLRKAILEHWPDRRPGPRPKKSAE